MAPAQHPPAHDATARSPSKPAVWVAVSVAAALVISVGVALQFWGNPFQHNPLAHSDATAAIFVGSQTCAGCQRTEAELWRSSHHKHAMAHASDSSVRGDFDNASFTYYGVRSRFFRKDGKFLVETDGPDRKLAVFQIKYTFGIEPLQQNVPRRPRAGPVGCLGHAAEGRRRPMLVPLVSERAFIDGWGGTAPERVCCVQRLKRHPWTPACIMRSASRSPG
jgi:hypothetical protein